MGTSLLWLTPSPGDTPTAHTRSDALGYAAELRFVDSVARYSHAGWKQEQNAEQMYHAMMRYVSIGRPLVLSPDFSACYPSHKRPSRSDIKELAGKGQLHTTDDDIVLLVGNATLPPTRFGKLTLRVELLACSTMSQLASTSPCSCVLGSGKLATRWPLVTLAPRARCACWSGFLVDWHESVYPVVPSPLLEVQSVENPTATCPLAYHLNASTGMFRCRRQC